MMSGAVKAKQKQYFSFLYISPMTPQVVLAVKDPPANAGNIGDNGLIPGSGRSPRRGHGNPLQYSCLENPVDREAWQTTVCRLTKS